MPIFAARVLGGGAHTLVFLMASSGVGALAGAVVLAARRSDVVQGLGRRIVLTTALFGAAPTAFSFSKMLWLSMLLLAIAGFGMMQQLASRNTFCRLSWTTKSAGA